MSEITTIGLDLAKSVFQVHGVDASGETVLSRQLRRRQLIPFFKKLPSCLIGVEACATSHHWARELQSLGHEVRIMPANYVKPYLKRNKNDAADAEARITAPLLALWGAKGVVGRTYDVLETWREKATDVSGRALDCGHTLQEERPDAVLSELAAFLR